MHFPTDNGLLFDAIRKTIILTSNLCEKHNIKGLRQKNHNIKKIKNNTLRITQIKKSKPRKELSILKKQNKLKAEYGKLINNSNSIIKKSKSCIKEVNSKPSTNFVLKTLMVLEIEKYINFAELFIDQIKRRVFNNEKIPHNEKVFSVFEPHTEWICKGKAKAKFELGKRVAIVEDQYGFILSSKVMDKETDEKIAVQIVKETKQKFLELSTCSFDKGFYSKKNREELDEILDLSILPKKGRLSKNDKELESSKEFKKYRKKHSSVESAINALEVHGLDKCLDKGFYAFKRYVALAMASRNIQKIGAFMKIKSIKYIKKQKPRIAS